MLPNALIFYDSRSGSTMLAAMLNQYRGVAVSHENSVLSHILEQPTPLATKADVDRLVHAIWDDAVDRELGLSQEAYARAFLDAGLPLGRRRAIEAFTALYFSSCRPPGTILRVVKHSPYRHVNALRALIPGLRILHLVRDGRAVFVSKRDNRGVDGRPMERSVIKAALDWRRKVRALDALPNVLTIRYESLVEAPASEVKRILTFLGVPPEDQQVVRPLEAYGSQIGEQQKGLHRLVTSAPTVASVSRWEAKMSPQERFVYEHVAAEALAYHQYPVASPPVRKVHRALALARAWLHYGAVRASNAMYTASAPRRLQRRLRQVGTS